MTSPCSEEELINLGEGDKMDTDDEPQVIKTILSERTQEKLSEMKKAEGNVFYKQGKYREALPFYTEALDLNPENATLYLNRAACLMMINEPGKALADCQAALRLDPANVKALSREAKCHILLGDASAASRSLSRLATIDPKHSDLATEMKTVENIRTFIVEGDKAYAKGDYRKCVYCMDRALSIAPRCTKFQLLRAECCAFLKRFTEARDTSSDIIRSDGSNADAYYVRGLVLYYDDQIEKAIQHFQQVLKLAPDHDKALKAFKRSKALRQEKELGNEMFKADNCQKAYEIYSKALSIDPLNHSTNAKLHFNRAQCCVKLRRLNEAVDDCSKAIEMNSAYQKAYIRRARCYLDLEMYEEAVRDFEHVYNQERTRENKSNLDFAKLELKKSKRKDYYKILGVTKNASTEEIKKAYKKKALIHHPDRHANSSDKEKRDQEKLFKELGEAFAVLSDPKKKTRYDNGFDLEEINGGGGGFDHAHMDPFRMFFGTSGFHQQESPFGMNGGGYEFNFR